MRICLLVCDALDLHELDPDEVCHSTQARELFRTSLRELGASEVESQRAESELIRARRTDHRQLARWQLRDESHPFIGVRIETTGLIRHGWGFTPMSPP